MTVKEWAKIRRELKRQFDAMGIRRCERCNGTFALSWAHRLKRRFIVTDEEKRAVALLCQPCHERIEHSGHAEMFAAITELIERRSTNY